MVITLANTDAASIFLISIGSPTGVMAGTLSFTPTQGNHLVAVIALDTGATTTVLSISQVGVAWTLASRSTFAGTKTVEIWIGAVTGTSPLAALSVNFSGVSQYASMVVAEWRGLSGAVDRTAGAIGVGTAVSSGPTPTTTVADELWVGGFSTQPDTNNVFAPLAGFTIRGQNPGASTGDPLNSERSVMLDLVVASTGVATAAATQTIGNVWAATVATFPERADLDGVAVGAAQSGGAPELSLSMVRTLPSITRPGSFEIISELAPREQVELCFEGDASAPANNRLVVSGPTQLAVDPAYAPQGTPANPYTFSGPANASSNPVQLGFNPGDKIRLTDPGATGANHLREFTLVNPATIEVFETVITPDATSYEFQVFRRLG